MKRILVVCAGDRDKRELKHSGYEYLFHQFNIRESERLLCGDISWFADKFDPQRLIDNVVDLCRQHTVDGIISSNDYPGSVLVSIVAHQLGFVAPSSESVLACHHKYYSRCLQKKYVPEATPYFCSMQEIDDTDMSCLAFPLFIKPVKSQFSMFACKIASKACLQTIVPKIMLPTPFLDQFDWFINHYASFRYPSNALLLEQCLQGVQVTLEGYVFNKQVHFFGVVDSIMFPGTISFNRFIYPSSLDESVQLRMQTIAKKFVESIMFDNGFFNIEFMYNRETDRIHIIEINPRMVSQFADLYEKVDGINSYSLLSDIAIGHAPDYRKIKPKYAVAASFVLRVFEDKFVVKVPSQDDLERFYTECPDGRFELCAEEKHNLSDALQDGNSFRYGLIHLGGQDERDLFEKFEQAKQLLPFILRAARAS